MAGEHKNSHLHHPWSSQDVSSEDGEQELINIYIMQTTIRLAIFFEVMCVWSLQEAAIVCPRQVAAVRQSYKWSHLTFGRNSSIREIDWEGAASNWAGVSGCVGRVSDERQAFILILKGCRVLEIFAISCVCFTGFLNVVHKPAW